MGFFLSFWCGSAIEYPHASTCVTATVGLLTCSPSLPVDYPHTSIGEDLDVAPFSSEGLTASCSLVSGTCLIYCSGAKVQRLQSQTLRFIPPDGEDTSNY